MPLTIILPAFILSRNFKPYSDRLLEEIRMKRVVFAFLLVLLLTFALQKQSAAESDGPSVSGSFQISTDGGPTRYIKFYSRIEKNGRTTGETIIQDRPSAPDQNGDSGDRPWNDSSPPFFAKAEFDCLSVNGNRAVMSGSVTESNSAQYIGRRLLLVVQDGDDFNPPRKDRLTFGIYRQTAKVWLPSDSERPAENGGPVEWIIQDSERPDDEPVSSQKNEVIGCQTFPISSFSFINANLGHGSIEIRP
jgi:hypothetical protein